jgi:short subunit dehydrogenase-like uncharacterized protein
MLHHLSDHGPGHVLLYGATGFTGRKVARRALERGIPLLLAGRDPSKLAACAAELGGAPHVVVRLDDQASLLRALDGAVAVLNAAGPFEDTMPPVLQAALEAKVHYLDLSGEARTIDRALSHGRAARAQGCMIMPAIGFDVVASDCLALHVVRKLPSATRLALGVFGLEGFSRGSGRSIARQAGAPVLVRREGALAATAPGALRRSFECDGRTRSAVAVTWADVVTAWISTGVPSIETYFGETPELLLAIAANRMLHDSGLGPLAARALDPFIHELNVAHDDGMPEPPTAIVAEARSDHGEIATASLRCPGPYTFTALAAVAVLERVIAGDVEPGFETPARVYGADFVLSVPGVVREEAA